MDLENNTSTEMMHAQDYVRPFKATSKTTTHIKPLFSDLK